MQGSSFQDFSAGVAASLEAPRGTKWGPKHLWAAASLVCSEPAGDGGTAAAPGHLHRVLNYLYILFQVAVRVHGLNYI